MRTGASRTSSDALVWACEERHPMLCAVTGVEAVHNAPRELLSWARPPPLHSVAPAPPTPCMPVCPPVLSQSGGSRHLTWTTCRLCCRVTAKPLSKPLQTHTRERENPGEGATTSPDIGQSRYMPQQPQGINLGQSRQHLLRFTNMPASLVTTQANKTPAGAPPPSHLGGDPVLHRCW